MKTRTAPWDYQAKGVANYQPCPRCGRSSYVMSDGSMHCLDCGIIKNYEEEYELECSCHPMGDLVCSACIAELETQEMIF